MAMLSSSSTPCPCRTGVSDYERMVCLKDWWLVKAENRLVVAGISSHCLKLFTSQPIAKRHDMFTVEDAHGLTLTIQGSINRSRSIQNGFSPQACDHFLIGFPYYWHQYTGEESTTSTFRTNDSGLPDAWHTLNDGDFQRKFCKQKTENFPDDALKNSMSPLNVEVAVSSDVELHAAEESLNRCRFGGPETTLNTSMENGRDCSTEKLRTNMRIASKDCCVPAATISDGKKVTPSEGYRISPVYSSRRLMGLKKMESLTNQINAILSPKSKGRNMYASVPNDHSCDTKIHIKMKSCDVNSSNLSDINMGSVTKEIFASPDDNPTRSRRNCRDDIENDDTSKDPSVGTDSVVNGANPSEVSSSRRRSASITSVPSQEKMDKFEKMKGSVEVRRSSRLKKTNTNIDCRLETERNEINAVSLCHDFGKHAIDNLDTESEDIIARDLPSVSLGFDFLEVAKDYFHGESRDNYVMDLPSVGFQGSMRESSIEANNESTEHVLQIGSLFSPHPTDSIQEQNHLSIIPGTEKIEQREFCMSTLRLDDACCTDYLKSPLGGEENLHSELRTSHKTTKRKLECITNVTSPPLTRNRRKLISCISPDYFSCKKSKSGRLLVPALDFWRNQQVVYDMDGQIVGVPKSMTGVETSAGSSSSNLT